MEHLVDRTVAALKLITIPRYFNTERGFATEFYSQLQKQIIAGDIPEHAILEVEVQKRKSEHHGETQRPDLLIHIPIETGLTNNTNENNFVDFAFKLDADPDDMTDDFEKLDRMARNLNYENLVFINIGSYPKINLEQYHGGFQNIIHDFSIRLQAGVVQIKHSCFVDGNIVTTEK